MLSESSRTILRRLRAGSLPELAYRALRAVRSRQAENAVRRGRDPVRTPRLPSSAWESLSMPRLRTSLDDSALQRILDGERFTLNCSPAEMKGFEDEVRGKLTSEVVMNGAGPDIRAVWEAARLQHVTAVIAHALGGSSAAETGEEDSGDGNPGQTGPRLRAFVEKTVLEWLDANPFLRGPHYLSAMECGLRIPVFLHALIFLGVDAGAVRERILDAVYRHAWWISRRLSLYASLGNHTVCECLGLVFAGAVYGGSRAGRGWLRKGIRILEQEVSHQVLPDGGPAEQSLSYHRFVLDVYWLALDFLEANALHDCRRMKERLEAGESFYGAFRDCGGHVPRIGDSDDGFAAAPSVQPRRSGGGSIASPCLHFEASGCTVLRGTRDALLTFDHGPLGMPPLYNHGHADALSFTLSVAGQPIVVDPGTYRYNGEPLWRSYFKGTRAHSTVTVDGLDQAVQETGFIWSRPYGVRLVAREEIEDGWIVEAEHDGYGRLREPVFHRRRIRFWRGRAALVRDAFRGWGEHAFEWNAHLHPDAVVSGGSPWWRVEREGVCVFVRLLTGKGIEPVRGRTEPPLGWVSEAYGIKRKCTVLQASERGVPEQVEFVTVLSWDGPLAESDLERLMIHRKGAKCAKCAKEHPP